MKTACANPVCRREGCAHKYSGHHLNGPCFKIKLVGPGRYERCFCGGFLYNTLLTTIKKIFHLKDSQIRTLRK